MTSITDEFEKSSKTPHDTAFRLVFRKNELAGSFFRHYLPENIAGHVDFRTLKTVNKSFVDKNFRQVHSDMVYEIRLKGKTAFFCRFSDNDFGKARGRSPSKAYVVVRRRGDRPITPPKALSGKL